MISAFIVRVAEWRYAINVGQIIELVYVAPNRFWDAMEGEALSGAAHPPL
jgi:hypothetical protein